LFLSRPTANIAGIINTLVKPIGIAEGGEDINAYVNKTLEQSQKLKTFFEGENIDPIQYFQQKSNGIFLSVSLVLQQLEDAKSKLAFQKRLNGFSKASGSMDNLYVSILSRVDSDDHEWVREILYWLSCCSAAIICVNTAKGCGVVTTRLSCRLSGVFGCRMRIDPAIVTWYRRVGRAGAVGA
jgi:hypothetical protein